MESTIMAATSWGDSVASILNDSNFILALGRLLVLRRIEVDLHIISNIAYCVKYT